MVRASAMRWGHATGLACLTVMSTPDCLLPGYSLVLRPRASIVSVEGPEKEIMCKLALWLFWLGDGMGILW